MEIWVPDRLSNEWVFKVDLVTSKLGAVTNCFKAKFDGKPVPLALIVLEEIERDPGRPHRFIVFSREEEEELSRLQKCLLTSADGGCHLLDAILDQVKKVRRHDCSALFIRADQPESVSAAASLHLAIQISGTVF